MSSHWNWMSPLFPSSVWTVTSVQWMKIDFTLCVSEPSCAVCDFDCIFFLLLWGVFFILWHAKTSILESVKLLKRASVHGSGLEFLSSVFVLLLFLLVCFKLYFYPHLHFVQCLLSLLFHHLEAMSMEVCSSNTLYSLCLPSYVYLNMKLTCCWFDSLLLCCSENAWHEHMLFNRGFPLLALALPRCLVMLSRLPLLMLLAASKGNKWF